MEILNARKLVLAVLLLLMTANLGGDSGPEWKQLAPGLDLASFKAIHPAPLGDSKITVLRIDPNNWELEFAGISQGRETTSLTTRQWCSRRNFTAAINAGMFLQDIKTHLGYLRFGDHVNGKQVANYQSVAAFGPRHDGLPRFHIFDLDAQGITLPGILNDYSSVVQNMRMIQRPGVNRWRQKEMRSSQAALGEDDAGRILFIFARSPFTTYELNQELLAAHIGLVAAQYLEGGPEAQLYVHTGATELEMFGSFATAFLPDDTKTVFWPIPNVLAIRPRTAQLIH